MTDTRKNIKAIGEAKLLCADIIHTREKITLALEQLSKVTSSENREYTRMQPQDLIERITDLEVTLERVIPTLNYAAHITDDLSLMAKDNLDFLSK